MDESILATIKKLLGIDAEYKAFDVDITNHINAALFTLGQLGVGPVTGFYINDDTQIWRDLGIQPNKYSAVQSYVYLKTRLLFDPPASGTIAATFNEEIKQLEWRLNVQAETSTP